MAERMGWPMVEGDDFHSDHNRALMRAGIPLGDAEREGWLHSLAGELLKHEGGAVVTCSALKRRYRDLLRASSPGLGFVFLEITQEAALRRVRARDEHFFPAKLLQSQFETLEPPVDETRILRLDGELPLESLADQTVEWLAHD